MEQPDDCYSVLEYKKADCALFRTPPIDFTPVKSQLEQAIINAWKNGANAQTAVQQILTDPSILDPLKRQITQYMDFQKSAEMALAEKEKFREQQRLEEEKRKKISEIDNTLGQTLAEKNARATNYSLETENARQTYDAAQNELEKMRARIKASLGELGGMDGYETVLKINESLSAPDPAVTSNPGKGYAPAIDPSGSQKSTYLESTIGPARPKREPDGESPLERIAQDADSEKKPGEPGYKESPEKLTGDLEKNKDALQTPSGYDKSKQGRGFKKTVLHGLKKFAFLFVRW